MLTCLGGRKYFSYIQSYDEILANHRYEKLTWKPGNFKLLSEFKITENVCTANYFTDRPSTINIWGMRSRKDTAFPWSPPGSTGTPCTSRSEKTNSSAPEVRPVRPHSPVRHSTRQPSRTSLLLSQRQRRLYINGIQVTERFVQGTKPIFWLLRVSNWSASLVCCCQVLLVPKPQRSVNVMANKGRAAKWLLDTGTAQRWLVSFTLSAF
jgi:hypothetical protein